MKQLFILAILLIGVFGHYIPGSNYLSGFDPIQSEFLSPIFNFTFTRNLSSNIEKNTFVPDQIVERTHSNGVFKLFSDIYTKTTEINDLKDMKITADAKWKSFFGSLNFEKLETAKYLAEHDVNILRVYLSINTHDLVLQDTSLIKEFKERIGYIYDIASHFNITSVDTDYPPVMQTLNYLIDDIYRIFGTHHVWRATFGGILAVDFVVQTDTTNKMTEEQLKAHASAGFAKIFKIDMDFNEKHTEDEKFKQSIKNQYVKNCGGSPWNDKMTVKDWEDSVIDKPCIIDYDIRPNSDLINADLIETNDDTLTKDTYIQAIRGLMIKRADFYYHQNTYGGCTIPSATNFLWYANLDDGSCQKEDHHQPYGGFWIDSDCPQFDGINHDTERKSCRKPYKNSPLIQGAFIETGTYKERICYYWHPWFWRSYFCTDVDKSWQKVCHENVHQCTFFDNSTVSNGYYVGGMYSPLVENIVTDAKSCPSGFHDRIIYYYDQNGHGIHICEIGHDEVAEYPPGAIKFGGMFNCKVPHPKTNDFKCPAGYMKHSLGSIQACDWWYCIHNSDMKHRVYYYPPGYGSQYPDFPFDMISKNNLIKILDDDSEVSADSNSKNNHLNGAQIFGIICGVIIGIIILGAVGFALYYSMKKPKEKYETLN